MQDFYLGRVRVEATDGGCHVWTGCLNSKGYGVRTVNSKRVLAHRQAWEDTNGEIPAGHQIHHACGVKTCLNPEHMEVVAPMAHAVVHRPKDSPARDALAVLRASEVAMSPMEIAWHARQPTPRVQVALSRALHRGEIRKVGRGEYIAASRRGWK